MEAARSLSSSTAQFALPAGDSRFREYGSFVDAVDISLELSLRQVRAPLYKYITSNNVFALARKAAFAFFAVPGTERNETFLDAVRAAVPDKTREVIVACMRGGSLNVENKPGVSFGFSSPSLKAVYVLRQAGYKNVTHLGGGVYEWVRAGQPAEEAEG